LVSEQFSTVSQLAIGLYDVRTGERLSVREPTDSTDGNRVIIGFHFKPERGK
jgi:hypothetical protein